MRTVWRVLVRTVFWSYERGTWPYDIAVAAIVLFVFLSPRSWFHDQPQVGPTPYAARVQLLGEDPASQTKTYRLDARLLAPPRQVPELERELHQALRKNVPVLRDRTFTITHYDAIRGEDGTVVYYDVSLKP